MDEYLPDRFICSMEHWDIISTKVFKVTTRALLQVSAVCLQCRHRDIISKQTVGVGQIFEQLGILGGAGWGDSSADPHQLPSKGAQSNCILLGVPPQLFPETGHRYGHLEEQHKFVSIVWRPPSCRGWDYDEPIRGWSKGHSPKSS